MKYDNSRAFEKHLEEAAPQHFSPVYVILSKDPVELQEAVANIFRTISPQNLEQSLTVIDGTEATQENLLADLHSCTLFSDTRLFWIQQADKLKKNVLEALEKYLARIPRSQYLILSALSMSKQSHFYKAAEKIGVILEFTEPKPWEKEKKLIEWATKQLSLKRKLISYQVCQFLVKQTGLDSSFLFQELEKLLCYVGDRQEITQQDIIKICHHQPSDTIWQLGEALFKRDSVSALFISQSLLTEGQSLLPLLRQIRSQFQTQLHICMMLSNGKSAHEVSQEFPYLKGNLLDRTLQQANRYGLESFKQGILAIDATELRVKNSYADEKLLMELLVIQLTRTN